MFFQSDRTISQQTKYSEVHAHIRELENLRNDHLKGVLLPDISKEFGGDCSAGVGRGRFTKGKEAL